MRTVMSERETYGKIVYEHMGKHALEDDVIEYRRLMEPEVLHKIDVAIRQALNHPVYDNKDFYIVLLFKVERIGQAPRTFALARQSCPTPVYKQAVWKYHRSSGDLQFLWSIPDAILYHHICNNPAQYLADKETEHIAKFVLLMESGELLEWVKKENGGKKDAVIKINQEPVCIMK